MKIKPNLRFTTQIIKKKGRLTSKGKHLKWKSRHLKWEYSVKQYLDLMKHILDEGVDRGDRTGTGTRAVFGNQMRFDLAEGFPLVTTKKIVLRSVIHELLWFLRGDTNIAYLNEHDVHIWDDWADEDGDLGPVYGYQWRSWPTPTGGHIDQIADVLESLKNNPNSRRHIVTAWNPADVDKMNLPPCHCLFQFFVADGKLTCHLYQRSCDFFLGVPFNIASYALLTHMFAQQCDLDVGEFVWTGGDVHLYSNHFEQAEKQLSRKPYPLPRLKLKKATDIDTYEYEDIEIIGYQYHPFIKAPIAV